MTDFALSSGNHCRPYFCPWGATPIRNMPISTGISSNRIFVGAVVGLDVNTATNGHAIVPSSQTSNTIVSTAIVGIAAEDPSARSSTTTYGTVIPVWDANPNVEFRAHTRNGLLQSSVLGQAKDLLWDSTLNILLVNVGASCLGTPLPAVIVTKLIDAVGDSGGAVAFKFCAKSPTSSLSTGRILAFYA